MRRVERVLRNACCGVLLVLITPPLHQVWNRLERSSWQSPPLA